jgi:uncharacterized protein YqkB
MSRTLTAKCDIKNLNEAVAKEALEAIAKTYNAKVSGLEIQWGRYGFFRLVKSAKGFDIQYDTYSSPITFEQFQRLFKQHYNVVACRLALQRAGYQVQTATRENKVFIRGVAYG